MGCEYVQVPNHLEQMADRDSCSIFWFEAHAHLHDRQKQLLLPARTGRTPLDATQTSRVWSPTREVAVAKLKSKEVEEVVL
jgi:hypothetical protein